MSRPMSMSKLNEAIGAGAAFPLIDDFIFQSYFDSTLLQKAIVVNDTTNSIASSTMRDKPIRGVGIALLPVSQTPIAVLPVSDSGNAATSSAVVIRPGEVYYPGTAFRALKYGLPYGWLGGGAVYMVILRENMGDVFITGGSPEIIYHRIRLPVWAITDNPTAPAANWPSRFPWNQAKNSSTQDQSGAPFLAPTPTRTLFRVRKANLGAGGVLRWIGWQTEDLDATNITQATLDQNGVPTYDTFATSASAVEIGVPAMAASGFQMGAVAPAEFPIITQDSNTLRIAGDKGTVALVDMTGAIGNANFVDIVRYGVL